MLKRIVKKETISQFNGNNNVQSFVHSIEEYGRMYDADDQRLFFKATSLLTCEARSFYRGNRMEIKTGRP